MPVRVGLALIWTLYCNYSVEVVPESARCNFSIKYVLKRYNSRPIAIILLLSVEGAILRLYWHFVGTLLILLALLFVYTT